MPKTKKPTKKPELTDIEELALGMSLCNVEEYDSYEDALKAVENGEASIWEPFENYDAEWIIENIENTKISLERLVAGTKK